jgi:hyperosmotically inducible protein
MTMMLCLTLSGAIGAAPAAKAEAGKPQRGDSWVTAKTKIALFADSRVKGREINVETKAGVVMLRGKVDTDDAKTASDSIAKGIEGALDVKNELQVVPRSTRAAVDEKDDVIRARVITALKAIRRSNIGVKVNAGVVSLNGDSDTWANCAKASWKAWRVDGVKFVKNDVTVKE